MPGLSEDYMKKSFPEKVKEEIKIVENDISKVVEGITIKGITLGEKEFSFIKDEASKLKKDVVNIGKNIMGGEEKVEGDVKTVVKDVKEDL